MGSKQKPSVVVFAAFAAAALSAGLAAGDSGSPSAPANAEDQTAAMTAGEAALFGFPSDPARALPFFLTASEAQDPRQRAKALWYRGMLAKDGLAGRRDVRAAYSLIAQSAEGGFAPAMVSRAVMLASGEGVTRDLTAARAWYQRAAGMGEAGSAAGLRGLGAMLIKGEGGPADRVRGIAYLQLAAEAGDALAGRLLAPLIATLDAAGKEKVAAAAAEWLAANPRPVA